MKLPITYFCLKCMASTLYELIFYFIIWFTNNINMLILILSFVDRVARNFYVCESTCSPQKK